MDRAVFDSIEREIDGEVRARFPADVIKQAVLLHHGDDPEIEPGELFVTAIRYQMRAPWADRSPALARLEVDLLVGIAQGDPHAAVKDIEGVLDIGVVVPGDLLRGTHPQL